MDLGIIGKALAGAGKGLGQANMTEMRASILAQRDAVLNSFHTQAQERGIQAQGALQSQKLGAEQAMQGKQIGAQEQMAGQRSATQLKLGQMQLGPEEQKAQAFMLSATTAATKGQLQVAQLKMLQDAWGNVVNAQTPAERATALDNFNELRGTPQFRGLNMGFDPATGMPRAGGLNVFTGGTVSSTPPGAPTAPSGTPWSMFGIPGAPAATGAQQAAAAATSGTGS